MLTRNTDKLRAEIAAQIKADAMRGEPYWDGRTGWLVGSLTNLHDAALLGDLYGLPLPLVRAGEGIFARLPTADKPLFLVEFGEAIGGDGRDLTRVHFAFMADTLRHLPDTAAACVVAPVIDGMERLARGEDWPEAAEAKAAAAALAAEATWTAWPEDAADALAAATVWAAAAGWVGEAALVAADAAWKAAADIRASTLARAAETQRQRRALLTLIGEAA